MSELEKQYYQLLTINKANYGQGICTIYNTVENIASICSNMALAHTQKHLINILLSGSQDLHEELRKSIEEIDNQLRS